MKLEYEIKAIMESAHKEGYVDIWMEPTERWVEDADMHPPMMVTEGAGMFPKEVQGMLMQVMGPLQHIQKQKRKEEHDPRSILVVMDRIEFEATGWKWGDIVDVSMKKKGK